MKNLEDAIVGRLKTLTTLSETARVLSWPDKPAELGRPTGSAAVLVRFMGVNLVTKASPNVRSVCQSGSLSVEIRFLVKNLRSHSGAYGLMESVQDQLSGWQPPGTELPSGYSANMGGFTLRGSQLIEHDQSIWDWGQQWIIPVMYIKQRTKNA